MPLGPMRTKAQKQAGMHEVMHEYKHGKLHSGSKKGPVVKSRAQAIAIALKQTHQSKYQTGGQVPRLDLTTDEMLRPTGEASLPLTPSMDVFARGSMPIIRREAPTEGRIGIRGRFQLGGNVPGFRPMSPMGQQPMAPMGQPMAQMGMPTPGMGQPMPGVGQPMSGMPSAGVPMIGNSPYQSFAPQPAHSAYPGMRPYQLGGAVMPRSDAVLDMVTRTSGTPYDDFVQGPGRDDPYRHWTRYENEQSRAPGDRPPPWWPEGMDPERDYRRQQIDQGRRPGGGKPLDPRGALAPPTQLAGDVVPWPMSPQVDRIRRLNHIDLLKHLRSQYGDRAVDEYLRQLHSAPVVPGPGYTRQVGGGLPYYARQGMYGMARSGMVASSSAGRMDKIGAKVKGGSYVIPADIVSAAGQGNSLAGAAAFNKLLSQGPYTSMMPHVSAVRSRYSAARMPRSGFQVGGATPPPKKDPMTHDSMGRPIAQWILDLVKRTTVNPVGWSVPKLQFGGDVVPLGISPGPQAGRPTQREVTEGIRRGIPSTIRPLVGPDWQTYLQRMEQANRGPWGPRGFQLGGATRGVPRLSPYDLAGGEVVRPEPWANSPGPPAENPLYSYYRLKSEGNLPPHVKLAPKGMFDSLYTRRLLNSDINFDRGGFVGLAGGGYLDRTRPFKKTVKKLPVVPEWSAGETAPHQLDEEVWPLFRPLAPGKGPLDSGPGPFMQRGGGVPVMLSGGEFVIDPEDAAHLGGGDIDHGHNVLDEVVRQIRRRNVHDLRSMPGPKQAASK